MDNIYSKKRGQVKYDTCHRSQDTCDLCRVTCVYSIANAAETTAMTFFSNELVSL